MQNPKFQLKLLDSVSKFQSTFKTFVSHCTIYMLFATILNCLGLLILSVEILLIYTSGSEIRISFFLYILVTIIITEAQITEKVSTGDYVQG